MPLIITWRLTVGIGEMSFPTEEMSEWCHPSKIQIKCHQKINERGNEIKLSWICELTFWFFYTSAIFET